MHNLKIKNLNSKSHYILCRDLLPRLPKIVLKLKITILFENIFTLFQTYIRVPSPGKLTAGDTFMIGCL